MLKNKHKDFVADFWRIIDSAWDEAGIAPEERFHLTRTLTADLAAALASTCRPRRPRRKKQQGATHTSRVMEP